MEEQFINFVTDILLEDDEAVAALNVKNEFLKFCKFVLTDDSVNANKQRIPMEEFPNLIQSGVFMPIKMAKGKIQDGHEEAEPLGVITHLKQEGNKVIGLAGLWVKERESDIQLIRERTKAGNPIQLSWEILYSNTNQREDGVEELLGTSLRATTIVGLPAYAGKTPILAIASKKEEESSVEELELLKTKIAELETLLKEKEDALTAKNSEIQSTSDELNSLREFKSSIDKKEADETKLKNIKVKFEEAGLQKDESFYSEKRDILLGMDETNLDFFVQEMVSLSKTSTASEKKPKVPAINGTEEDIDYDDPIAVGRKLRELRSKK